MQRLGVLVLVLASTAIGQDPHADAVRALSARVVKTVESSSTCLLLQVEVTNRGPRFAEPADFVFRVGDELTHAHRFALPYAGRRGRATPPSSKQTYWLSVATAVRGKRAPSVEVADAVFHDGPALEPCPVTLGRIRHDDVEESGLRFPATFLTTGNTLDRPVDVLLLADCEKPTDGRRLFPVRIEPGADREITIHEAGDALDFEHLVGGTLGVRIRKAEVVDWTAVFDDPGAPVLDAFATAWSAWLRWPSPPVGWGGTFSYRSLVEQGGAPVHFAFEGRWVIGADGQPQVRVDGDAGSGAAIERLFAVAFRDFTRPDLDALKQKRGLVPFDRHRVQVPNGPVRDEWGDVFEVVDGRIVGSTSADGIGHYGWTWTPAPLAGGYVIARREENQRSLGTTIREQRAHVVLAGGVVFPQSIRRDTHYGASRTSEQLVLADIAPERPELRTAPSGPAADALRAVWDAVYRYPDARADLAAAFEARHPNTDGVWGGVRRVRGALKLTDFMGFAMLGGGWRGCEFACDDPDLSPDARVAVTNAVDDRLGLWAGRDLAGRPTFESAFGGATVREVAPGRFEIQGGWATVVVAVDGIPREVGFADGRHAVYSWRKVGGALVPVEVRTGDEVLTAKWRDLGDGIVLPVEMRFERVFGRDWGPETMLLKDVRLGRRT